ncbi:hypothetical protein [Arthrobacter koreensis]|uniref:hypothetical protein n=1 Tax=Arthrobacter koreensis TaxID=199136 RepID=UPI002DBF059C|nr:hypothetical protein [Arthrobacter koreensis]MEB7447280.1 hypothetical protein [Arthrobacter koreensis]
MNTEPCQPVIATSRETALVEDFPLYLREATFAWLKKATKESHGYVYADLFVDFQNAYRNDLGFESGVLMNWSEEVLPYLRRLNHEHFTNFLDYVMSRSPFPRSAEHPLERHLSDGGSAWTVTRWNEIYARLSKRVSDGVTASVQEALSASDAASVKLQEAWMDAYGANPRASVAYHNAVVAVETAALSVIPAGGPEPTLANLFSILEADVPKWRLVFRDSEKAPGAKTLAAMLRTLWRGHASRHGRPEYTDASLEEARAAVILAATLVQWLTSGVVIPTSP